jgi:integrase
MPNNRVTLYHRDAHGYHRCDVRGIYPSDTTTFVLRYVGDDMKRVWETLPKGTDFATARKLALEKELRLSNPALNTPSLRRVPAKISPAPAGDGRVRIAEANDAYIGACWKENNLRARTIKDKATELKRWAEFMKDERKKECVDDIDRADLLEFRDWLFDDGYAPWTVKTNMGTAVTMLKRNPLRHVTGLLKRGDWPRIEDSEPRPYTPAEVKAMLAAANDAERLFIRFLVGSGCREMDWKPKTKAGTRTIPLPDSLVRDLKAARGKGLVFPAPRGGVDFHKLRLIQAVGERAGVEGAGLHRARDTFATEALRVTGDLVTVARWLGHRGLGTIKLYAEALQAKDERAREAVNKMDDRYALGVAAD